MIDSRTGTQVPTIMVIQDYAEQAKHYRELAEQIKQDGRDIIVSAEWFALLLTDRAEELEEELCE